MKPFEAMHKIPRLNRDCIITEKIDGTNASIYISEDSSPIECSSGRVIPFLAGSRTRWIFPENDNQGFATWAYENADELLKLGPGHHFGEWWGRKIGRKYGLTERRFSLFNVGKWNKENVPSCVSVVPTLYSGSFYTGAFEASLYQLKTYGSIAAPGFMQPEGIVIYHTASGGLFKVTLEADEKPKSII